MDKTPANPYEADLLLMAKIVASEEKTDDTEEVTKNDSGDDDDGPMADTVPGNYLKYSLNFYKIQQMVIENF